ncbi:hypothetical protein C8J57DRAFT_1704964 [Mycena rebaudengoi]|nr:hypothetical protein C8J57DRAFT_1704964 [Mycena rebaudengoi]
MPDGVRSLSDVFGGDAGGHGGVASVVLERSDHRTGVCCCLLVHVLWSLEFSTYWGHWLSIPLHARIQFTQDKCYSNCAWAKLSGLPARDIGRCEHALGDTVSGSAKRPLPPPLPPALPPSADRSYTVKAKARSTSLVEPQPHPVDARPELLPIIDWVFVWCPHHPNVQLHG